MRSIGIVPAAGLGSRLQPLPFSKELFPVGYQMIKGQFRSSPISQYLINAFKEADIQLLYFIINQQKMDIPDYYLNGSQQGMHFSYLFQSEPKGMVNAVAKVTPWLSMEEETLIFFGMPDTLFSPSNLFVAMKQRMLEQNFDVLLGVFPTKTWWKLGMVRFIATKNGEGEVIEIIDKPKIKPETDYAWGIGVWKLPFQQYLTQYQFKYKGIDELVLGDVFMSAIDEGMKIGCITGSEYEDIGTMDDLIRVVKGMNKG